MTRTGQYRAAAPNPVACPDWVSPEVYRAHVRALICETRLSWRLVAAHAGVSPRAIRALLHGREGGQPLRQLHVSVARALVATSVESIAETAAAVVDAAPSRALLQALVRLGWSLEQLGSHLEAPDLELIGTAPVCTGAAAMRVSACYDLLTGHDARARGAAHTARAVRVDSGQQPSSLDRKTSTRWCPASPSGSTAPAAR